MSIAEEFDAINTAIINRTAEVENRIVGHTNSCGAGDSNALKGTDAAHGRGHAITAQGAASNGRAVQIQPGSIVYRDGCAKVDDCRTEINVEDAVRENLDGIAIEDEDII